MYSEGREKAKVGRVQVDKHGNSYRLRFTYPESTRHQFTVSKATNEGWSTAIRAAQLINRDIDLGDFDETYARYSPKHAKKLAIAKQEAIKEYNLKELWEIYKKDKKKASAKTTQKDEWTRIDNLLDSVETELLELSNYEKFIEACKNQFALGTLNPRLRILYAAINRAVKLEMIKENAYLKVYSPYAKKGKKQVPECFEPDEVKAIIAAFYNNEYVSRSSRYKHSYYAQMVEFLALTGCRPEECHALTWDDIKYKKDKVFISFNKAYSSGILLPHTKTHTIRLFPCNEQLKNLIANIPKINNQNNLVFCSVTGEYINQGNWNRRYYTKVVKGLVKDGKVHKYLKPYCLRHSFITRLVRKGVDIATVAALSGNSVEVIMSNYLASRREFDLPEL